MRITSQEILQWTAGNLQPASGPLVFTGVSTDSRTVKPGDLFIALAGGHFDGHDFILDAYQRGALAAIVSRAGSSCFPVFVVPETLRALQQIAGGYRQKFSLPMIGVTGSVGKTTTKDLIAALFCQRHHILKTEGNYNNELGVPLTLLRLDGSYTAAVVEMGMRAQGEIAALAEMVKPKYGVITNIEPVHLETMGSLSAIAQAKCELLPALSAEGFAFINGDQPLLVQTAAKTDTNIFTFGVKMNNDVVLHNVQTDSHGLSITASLFGVPFTTSFPVPSPRLAMNVIAAAGLAYKMGIDIPDLKTALTNFQGSSGRLRIESFPEGGLVINDTYNAGPTSMQAALEALMAVGGTRRKIAVLGDMFELGAYAQQGHCLIGKRVAELGLDELVTIGSLATHISDAAIEYGLAKKKVHQFAQAESAAAWLIEQVTMEDAVLFKASRGMKLEKILDAWMSGGMGQ